MAYEEDRDMDLDETTNFEDDPVYGADTYFGERMDTADDMSDTAMDETVATDQSMEDGSDEPGSAAVESDDETGFGETLSTQNDDQPAAKPSDEE